MYIYIWPVRSNFFNFFFFLLGLPNVDLVLKLDGFSRVYFGFLSQDFFRFLFAYFYWIRSAFLALIFFKKKFGVLFLRRACDCI